MSKRRSNQRQADNVAVPKKIPRYEREAIVLPTERFIRFCEENQLEKVKACLALDVDVHTVSEGLWAACKAGHASLLSLLLQVCLTDYHPLLSHCV